MKHISIDDYTYSLPDGKIALFPLPVRDASKLLIWQNGLIREDIYRNVAGYLPEGSLTVFNQSRVLEARLVFVKPSGGKIEIFCLEPVAEPGNMQKALAAKTEAEWTCLIGGASKWKAGQVLTKTFDHLSAEVTLSVIYTGKTSEAFHVKFTWNHPGLTFGEVLHYAGQTPLPPYIRREAVDTDAERYQTIYASTPGSVAAPTAGLHFTDQVMDSMKARNIEREFVTLHVGAGTFRPVKAATMEQHEMHAEFIDVSLQAIERLLNYNGGNITAVGTTSMRTLESLFWIGIKIMNDPDDCENSLSVSQWFAHEHAQTQINYKEAFEAVTGWMKNHTMDRLVTSTQLLIAPGYTFRVADTLITNFHQPKSTLLLLVAALAGENWRNIYDYALNNNFRFLSYGDGCLIFKNYE